MRSPEPTVGVRFVRDIYMPGVLWKAPRSGCAQEVSREGGEGERERVMNNSF